MVAYRNISRQQQWPDYGELVLPTFIVVIGVDTVPCRDPRDPVLTRSGWHQYLTHWIKCTPQDTFHHLREALRSLGISIPLERNDLPQQPCPEACGKHRTFLNMLWSSGQQRQMARMMGLNGHQGGSHGGHSIQNGFKMGNGLWNIFSGGSFPGGTGFGAGGGGLNYPFGGFGYLWGGGGGGAFPPL